MERSTKLLSSVNHLFLWTIYTMAMLVITRGYILIYISWLYSLHHFQVAKNTGKSWFHGFFQLQFPMDPNLVGGFALPLWKIWVRQLELLLFPIYGKNGKIKHVPNHQPNKYLGGNYVYHSQSWVVYDMVLPTLIVYETATIIIPSFRW